MSGLKMNTLKLSTYITILFTLLFLSSCGGGGGASSSSSATGGQYNATVVGSTCEITLSNGATHTVTTDDTGIASFSGFTVPAGLTTMECGGGNYTSEYDESGKIAPTQRAATNYSGSGELTLIVTPLSNIAYNIASNTGNLAAAIDQINADVATTFGLSADFISTIPKDLNDGAITGATQADKLGIILANLSVLDGATAGSASQNVDSATELTNLATSVAGVTANDFNRTDNNANNSTTTVNTSTVAEAPAPTISGDSSVSVGSSITLSATGGTTNTIWISADTNIATVSDSGVVTGVADGTVVIIATNVDLAGNSATITITVNAVTYDVTYDANNATSGTAPTAQSKTHGSDVTLATNTGNLARTGYTFAGWNTEADGLGTDYAVGATYSTNAALTLYAKWAPVITYDVTYDANNATSGTTPTAQSKTHGSDLPLATNTGNLARTGYTFAGWNTEADGLGTDYAVGATYSTNAALTLYAKWAPVITYDVTYDANNATSGTTPTAQSKTHGSDLPLATNTGNLARTGYTFAGWNTEADGLGTDYAVGATYSTNAALTLYAKWAPVITYDVTYDANNATSGTTPTAQSKTHGSDLPLATNTGNLARTGYTFAGWNTEADGLGTDYAVGATYSTNAALTLYAKWAPNSVTMNDPIAGYGEISLSWSNSGPGATYNLYYAKESFASLDDISNYATLNGGTLLNSIATHKTINLTNGITYYFVVTAIQNNIESSASNEVSATPQGKLNDTGITWGGDYSSGNNSDCTGENISTQDCSHGRDAKAQAGTLQKVGAGHAGFDFTKISSSGAELPASSTSWSCVRDNHTGLLWEVKTDDDGIHDKNNTYHWGGLTALGRDHSSKEGIYYDDWNILVNEANSGSGLCGFTDWRVPTKEELHSIVDYSRTNPTIDTTYFPNTPTAPFWSSSPNALNSDNAWLLNFSHGNDSYNRNSSYRVRLVRLGE